MKRYVIKLTNEERIRLKKLITSGKRSARVFMHVMVLLKADQAKGCPAWPDEKICEAFDLGSATVQRIRKTFVEEGFDRALQRKPYEALRRHKKIDGDVEARLIALTCSDPPEGYARWSLRLLADKIVELGYVNEVSYETVRRTLKKTN